MNTLHTTKLNKANTHTHTQTKLVYKQSSHVVGEVKVLSNMRVKKSHIFFSIKFG